MNFNIFINRKQWEEFDEETMKVFKENIFKYYRENGFPYFNLSVKERQEDFIRLCNLDSNLMLEGNEINQIMTGLGFINHYMPHTFGMRSGNFKTPLESFMDDESLRMAIDKQLKIGYYMSDTGMRKVLSFINGTQKISNFRPSVAKFIYDKFGGEHVLDFSSGFGGRIMGACASSIKTYVGFEPCIETFKALGEMAKDLKQISSIEEMILINESFEDTEQLEDNWADCAFSSPPYFNSEHYSDEENQSDVRYKTIKEWESKFLIPTIKKCKDALHNGGYFIINVANTRQHMKLEKNTYEYALSSGFKYITSYNMRISKFKDIWKTEPILIFKKES